VFELKDWQVIGEYVFDNEGGRHQAFYSPHHDVTILGETIKSQERIQIEQSLKYSEDGMRQLWAEAGVVETDRWMTDGDEYGKLSSFHLPCPTQKAWGLPDLCIRSTNKQSFPHVFTMHRTTSRPLVWRQIHLSYISGELSPFV
jgi:hypothetical protein